MVEKVRSLNEEKGRRVRSVEKRGEMWEENEGVEREKGGKIGVGIF